MQYNSEILPVITVQFDDNNAYIYSSVNKTGIIPVYIIIYMFSCFHWPINKYTVNNPKEKQGNCVILCKKSG